MQNKIQCRRDIEYGKRLIITIPNNKALKKSNQNEITKKSVFASNRFIHFRDEVTKIKFNAFAIIKGYPEFMVEIKTLTLAKKPISKLSRQ